MAEPIYLLLGIHHHQPVGNFDAVFRMAFEKCYRSVLEAMERHPAIKFSLHHSGPLLDWAAEHEGDYLDRVAALSGRGQLEILGGGYYEPILPILKTTDALGQIELMQEFWQRRAGVRPAGMWLAERVWEPSLAALLHDAGMAFTILDDQHFRHAGLTAETLFGHWRTERAGKALSIFPSDKTLRYLVPFRLAEDVAGHLLRLQERHPGKAVTYGDDGEKFGVWPGTYDWVIGQGWLEKFLSELERHADRIQTITFSEYLLTRPPEGRVYLPTASYSEMLEWAMPPEAILAYDRTRQAIENAGLWGQTAPFFRGGFWDNFLTKYPESNLLHKRALFISDRLDAAEKKGGKLPVARRALYRAQCNCAYWHGLFGGLYLNYLRHALYENMIEADIAADRALEGDAPFFRFDVADIDRDGVDEVILGSRDVTCIVSPRQGGAIVALDWRPKRFNLLNTLARRFEAYHEPVGPAGQGAEGKVASIHDIGKDIGALRQVLFYDRAPRFAFLDHAFDAEPDGDALAENRYEEGCPLFALPYAIVAQDEGRDGARVALAATGQTKEGGTLSVEKEIALTGKNTIQVSYRLRHRGAGVPPPWFATEICFTLLAGHDRDRYYLWKGIGPGEALMDARALLTDVGRIEAVDRAYGFALAIEANAARAVLAPIETVSQSERGFDRIYQGSTVWLAWKPSWTKGGEAEISVGMSLKNI